MATTPELRVAPTTAAVVGGTSLTLPVPTGLVEGDLLLVVVAAGGSGSTVTGQNVAGGSGTWTKIAPGALASGFGALSVFYRLAGPSEPANLTVTFTGGSCVGACVPLKINTFRADLPIGSGSAGYTSDTAANPINTAPSVAGTTDGLLLNFYAQVGTGTGPVGFTMGSDDWVRTQPWVRSEPWGAHTPTQTEVYEANAGASGHVSTALGSRVLVTTGATGTSSATADASRRQVNAAVAIAPYTTVTGSVTVADAAAATDSVVAGKVITRTASDTAAGTDSALATSGIIAQDAAAATDAVTRTRTSARTLADRAPITDAVTADLGVPDITDRQFVLETLPRQPFGWGQAIVLESLDVGTPASRTQDYDSPLLDVRHFGVDRRSPPTWSFAWYTDVTTENEARAWASRLEEVWDQEEVRGTPGAVLALRYNVGGRKRRIYGRPREFAALETPTVRTGRLHMTGTFALSENTFYADEPETVTVRLAPPQATEGGFTFPVTFPMSTTVASPPKTELVVVGGTRPTWLDLTFYGPIVNPYVEIGPYRWGLRGVVLSGQSVLLSGVPWRAGVRRSDGAWTSDMLDPRARLSRLRLPPGTYEVTLGGSAQSSNARAEVTWHDAFGTM